MCGGVGAEFADEFEAKPSIGSCDYEDWHLIGVYKASDLVRLIDFLQLIILQSYMQAGAKSRN